MSKGAKTFLKVIYYLMAFIFGIILAVGLPYSFFYKGTMTYVSTSLKNGEYANAINVVGGLYNEDNYYYQELDNGGIVLFEAVTLVYSNNEENGNVEVNESKVHKSYAGFIFGIRETYDITSQEDNLSAIGIFDLNNLEDKSSIIEYSSYNNKKADTNSSIYLYDFLYVDLDNDQYNGISKIVLYDKNGSVYQEINCNLTFESEFFNDVNEFVDVYNTDSTTEEAINLKEEFLNKKESYKLSVYAPVQKDSNRKAIILIILYFIVVYIIGDSLLGHRYFIKGIKWILKKVFKVKFKSDEVANSEEVLGHDYLSTVSLSLDTSAAPLLDTVVIIRYSSSTSDDIEFTLTKDKNYTQVKKIKAGTYVNPFVEVNSNYKVINLPDNLKVSGYRMDLVIKIEE